MSSPTEFRETAERQRRLPDPAPDGAPEMRDWIRAGALAASSHNTQPWRVRIDPEAFAILIQPDDRRRCPVVDPHDAHLFKSLGCMAENIRIAAGVNGYSTAIEFEGDVPDIRLTFERAQGPGEIERYGAITRRQCTRTEYDGSSLADKDRDALAAAGRGDGVHTMFLTGRDAIERVVEFVERGNAQQLGDRHFRRELAAWIRFNPDSALRTRDGLASAVMGQRSLPQWLGEALNAVLLRAGPQSERDARDIRSAGALAVIVAEADERPAWVETGRVYQRLALEATTRGLKHAFHNQPIEVASLRAEFRQWMDVAPAHPMLMIRLGRADDAPFSLRRPLEEILAEPADG